jgi:hypothetical protein
MEVKGGWRQVVLGPLYSLLFVNSNAGKSGIFS